jgi:NAD(P)-dependent dehydrogenase (short-subunit alcohol dehydrogenase family)
VVPREANRALPRRKRTMIGCDLRGRAALVTGASAGLGRHFAELLASCGAHVVLAARRRDLVDEAAARIRASGGSAAAQELDVASGASVEQAVRLAGEIDILVNNAGITSAESALEIREADYDVIVNTNQKGSLLVALEVARAMKARGVGGTIINIASILGLRQAGHVMLYAMSKAAIIQMTKQLALELARFGIRCNALAPGYFETDLNRDFFATEEGTRLIKRIPQRRLGRAPDLDGPLLLLASDASRFMTGSVITVDGGHMVSSL